MTIDWIANLYDPLLAKLGYDVAYTAAGEEPVALRALIREAVADAALADFVVVGRSIEVRLRQVDAPDLAEGDRLEVTDPRWKRDPRYRVVEPIRRDGKGMVSAMLAVVETDTG